MSEMMINGDGDVKVDVREDGWIRMQLTDQVGLSFPPESALRIAYCLIAVTTREYPELEFDVDAVAKEIEQNTRKSHDRRQSHLDQ